MKTTPEQREGFTNYFNKHSADKKHLKKEEIGEILKKRGLKPTDEKLQKLIGLVSVDSKWK